MSSVNDKQDCRVWVGHIPDGIRSGDLREKFEKFGELSDIKFVRRGKDEHYAFLQFASVDEARDAISRMDNSDVFGGKIFGVFVAQIRCRCRKVEAHLTQISK